MWALFWAHKEQPFALNTTRLCSLSKSSGSSCILECDMLRNVKFMSPPIDVGGLCWPQPLRSNVFKFANWPNYSGDFDNEEQPLTLNSTRLGSFPKSSGSSCTPKYDMCRNVKFVSPPIDVGRLWSWPQWPSFQIFKFGKLGNDMVPLTRKNNPLHWTLQNFLVSQNPPEAPALLRTVYLKVPNSWAHQWM